MFPVILSGGYGTRLWPLSRRLLPKQFHRLLTDFSLIQETASLLKKVSPIRSPLIICNDEHRFIVNEQLQEIGITPSATILEPEGRNTAPAIAVAALHLLEKKQDPILLVCPSDHLIQTAEAFKETLDQATPFAENGKLVTFGITPTYPSEEYGYIQATEEHSIQEFVEKPMKEMARSLISKGNTYWNSGIFLFKASAYLENLKRYAPEIYKAAKESYLKANVDLDFIRLDADAFSSSPSLSIDHAVMEKTQDGVVIPAKFQWSDVGSWPSVWEHQEKDSSNNVLVGDATVFDTKNSYIRAENKLVVAVGVEGLVVVDTEDATLIMGKEKAHLLKGTVQLLTANQRKEVEEQHRNYRPWGYYEPLIVSDRYQVKKIVVKPGCKLSLQYHHHRAEHWVVVKGIAKVTRGEETYFVNENESVYIPLKEVHRLENPGNIVLEMIEVQSGSYLGEDDIVRLQDDYNRHEGSQVHP